ncbi:MAG: hypothetical protein KJ620_10895 [Candidatus Edwardsbacteria bacterium]|nr:hypothetical protein [Candidatus Edwardsbacteria bacterium]MBU1577320.1 hypothetical protein [Candidatus Edwardsbacteria bacterium]
MPKNIKVEDYGDSFENVIQKLNFDDNIGVIKAYIKIAETVEREIYANNVIYKKYFLPRSWLDFALTILYLLIFLKSLTLQLFKPQIKPIVISSLLLLVYTVIDLTRLLLKVPFIYNTTFITFYGMGNILIFIYGLVVLASWKYKITFTKAVAKNSLLFGALSILFLLYYSLPLMLFKIIGLFVLPIFDKMACAYGIKLTILLMTLPYLEIFFKAYLIFKVFSAVGNKFPIFFMKDKIIVNQ